MIFINILFIVWIRCQFFTRIKNISIRCGIYRKFWSVPGNIMVNNKMLICYSLLNIMNYTSQNSNHPELLINIYIIKLAQHKPNK